MADCRTYTVPGLTSTTSIYGNRDYFGNSYWGDSYWGEVWFEWAGITTFGVPDERTFIIEAEDRTFTVNAENRTYTVGC